MMASTRNIAVLDDDAELREEICDVLIAAGHHATGLADASGLGNANLDVLVLDLAMPGVDGVDVLGRLAKIAASPAIVLISGHGEPVLRAASRSAEAAGLSVLGVLSKPLDADRLVTLVSREPASARQGLGADIATIVPALERALAEDALPVHFQPKVHVDTLEFAGAEALLAGFLPGGIKAPPPLLVAAARDLPDGTIRLTHAVLRQAVRAVAAWTRAGFSGPVSVNLPIECLLATDAVPQLLEIVRGAGIDASQVTFELLEDSLYDSSADAMALLTKLRLAGFGLALDDLGQRQSGLMQLANLPVTEIKIDIEIVRQARSWEKARSIFASIAMLGKSLGIHVTAEGVETAADLTFVRSHPVDYFQGYLFSGKRSLDDLLEWIAGRGASLPTGAAVDGIQSRT
jgi:EAL domain-containing protein (putative c-di-GMP-specific phosphodiesterase class I)/ActR/RegA family two-component response regulator